MRKVPRFTVQHITSFLEVWAPPQLQFSYDNVGLLTGSFSQPVSNVLTTLDVTDEVIDEAIARETDLIIAHHPLIFPKVTRITDETDIGRMLQRLIKNDISLYVSHTNLDAAEGGVSMMLGETLGLTDLEVLENSDHQEFDGDTGMGAVGVLPVSQPMKQDAFMKWVAQRLEIEGFRYAGEHSSIKKVAVCGGAGVSLTNAALNAGADAFITADIKYHDYFVDHDQPFLLIDAGHFETEQMMRAYVRRSVQREFSDLHVAESTVHTNPMKLFTQSNVNYQSQPPKA